MSAIFPSWSNTVLGTLLVLGACGIVGVPTLLMIWVRTPYLTERTKPLDQPVEFDHRHHVNDNGMDCRYCHYTVERSPYAGVPPTAVCMACHAQVWTQATLLEPVRQSFFENRPIEWQKVHRLPDFAYFDHSAHTRRGVGCVSCHGRVDQMARVYRVAPLVMGWCLDCHRSPERQLRPREHVADPYWQAEDPAATGVAVKVALDIRPPVTCSGCHR
jgi:hypothetical protein